MTQIRHQTTFEAAHRQLGDSGKCGRLHGHNWVVSFILRGTPNELGYIVDFKNLDALVDTFDHAVLLKREDPLIAMLRTANQSVVALPWNPTCENLAEFFCNQIAQMQNVEFISVLVAENGRSSAEVAREIKRDIPLDTGGGAAPGPE